MVDKSQLSYSQLLSQIQLWQLTLRRELRRLNFLKKESLHVDRLVNKKIVNRIEIIETEIESQLLKYKKEKDKISIDFDYVIAKYDIFSKSFVDLMEQINQIHEMAVISSESSSELRQSQQYRSNIKATKPIQQNNGYMKNYMDDTFSVRFNRQQREQRPSNTKSRKPSQLHNKFVKHGQWLQKVIQDTQLQRKVTVPKNSTYDTKKKTIMTKHKQRMMSRTTRHQQQQLDFSGINDIKSQLRQLKSQVLNMNKKIDNHSHDQLSKDINKLKHNNKKMAMDIKLIKQQNSTMMHQIHQARKQIEQQRKLQKSMVRQLQKPQKSIVIEKHLEPTQDVSDWVRARLERLSS